MIGLGLVFVGACIYLYWKESSKKYELMEEMMKVMKEDEKNDEIKKIQKGKKNRKIIIGLMIFFGLMIAGSLEVPVDNANETLPDAKVVDDTKKKTEKEKYAEHVQNDVMGYVLGGGDELKKASNLLIAGDVDKAIEQYEKSHTSFLVAQSNLKPPKTKDAKVLEIHQTLVQALQFYIDGTMGGMNGLKTSDMGLIESAGARLNAANEKIEKIAHYLISP